MDYVFTTGGAGFIVTEKLREPLGKGAESIDI